MDEYPPRKHGSKEQIDKFNKIKEIEIDVTQKEERILEVEGDFSKKEDEIHDLMKQIYELKIQAAKMEIDMEGEPLIRRTNKPLGQYIPTIDK